jgi:hypothetical protein
VTDLATPDTDPATDPEPWPWHLGPRARIEELAETGRRLTSQNVTLYEELVEVQQRIGRAREICQTHYGDPFARRILHVLNGEQGAR